MMGWGGGAAGSSVEEKKKGLVVFGSVCGGCVCLFGVSFLNIAYSLLKCVKYSTKALRYSRVCYTGQLITS